MLYTKKSLNAQALEFLTPWVNREHRLTPAEAAAEAVIHQIFVNVNKPALSPLAAALAAVLSIPDVTPPGRGGTS